MTRTSDPAKALAAMDNLRAVGLKRRRGRYDFDFATPVGLLTSLNYRDGERKALVFRRPVGEDFMGAILALVPQSEAQFQSITNGATYVTGAPIYITEQAWFVIFDLPAPPPARAPTLIDSECNPMPDAFDLADNSRVRCAGRLTQREGKYVVLELRAIQVIDPAPGHASLFRPLMGGYVFRQ